MKNFSENKVHYTNNVYCEDKYILSYIDNGEVPPILTEIIDEWWCPKQKKEDAEVNTELSEAKSESPVGVTNSHPINHYSNVYYNGCILAEIRNHRLASKNPEFFQSYFILLKPSRLSYQNEISRIILSTSPKFKWDEKSVLKLESNIIYANAPKLYLGLNPNVYSLAKVRVNGILASASDTNMIYFVCVCRSLPEEKISYVTVSSSECDGSG